MKQRHNISEPAHTVSFMDSAHSETVKKKKDYLQQRQTEIKSNNKHNREIMVSFSVKQVLGSFTRIQWDEVD